MITLRKTAVLVVASLVTATVHARHFEHKEHQLGPTGLIGITSPTHIKITRVQEGSPAVGKIKPGDLIVAAGTDAFKENARREMADAIDMAETEEAKGNLVLTLEGGKKVQLQLKVLGSYSDTAPFNCPKTDAIITQTADHLVKTRKFGRGEMNIGLLGLLATGEQKYVDVVHDVMHGSKWAQPNVDPVAELKTGGRHAWGWGYTCLLLCEYYLLTGDEFVLPAIKAYSTAIATGRDAAGLWGHGMAYLEPNRGQLHGRLFGYAQINQSSLPLLISMILADTCGVKHRELQAGIEQTHAFFDSFVGKGALPYGVHNPFSKAYNNNGTSGSAAVALAIKGNAQGARFFSRMCVTSYDDLESGHTGHFFNQLWTGLGANMAGPEASAAFFKRTRWLHTLNRTWDGNFTYDCCEYKDPVFSYRGCSDAGSHLLNYCLGRRKLYITGKDADETLWLKGREVGDAVGLSTLDYANMGNEELLALFGHVMPQVRVPAIWTLRGREHTLLDAVKRMVKQGTPEQRESAISYFGYGCPAEIASPMLNELGAVLCDARETPDLRSTAASSLCWFGQPAYKHFADMLEIIVADEPEDRFGAIDESVGNSLTILCKDPYAAGLVTDKELFYKAVLKLLNHKRQSGRSYGTALIANIPIEDFHVVADKLLYIIEDKDLTYHSYHNPMGPKGGAIGILASLNVQEGIDYAFATLDDPTGKYGFKIRMIGAAMAKYAGSAKHVVPKLKELLTKGDKDGCLANAVKAIESDTGTRNLISFEEAKEAGRKAGK